LNIFGRKRTSEEIRRSESRGGILQMEKRCGRRNMEGIERKFENVEIAEKWMGNILMTIKRMARVQ
jgi:hypothetical protein